jgi:hypothetical protein
MRRLLACLALVLLPAAASAAPACVMQADDEAWITSSLARWETVRRDDLKLAAATRPTVVVMDETCAFTAKPGARLEWRGAPHGGRTVTLPDGQALPVGVASFAAPYDQDRKAFFVMGLPSLWRKAGVKSGLSLEAMMTGVLVHEIMHTRQFYFVTPQLAVLTKRYGLGDDVDDDSLQKAFKADPDYVKAYEAERDLLFAAAAAHSDAEAKALAGQALSAMRARRARFFTGEAEKWAPLDDIFLVMEGLGQWAFMRSQMHAPSPTPADGLINDVRRGGRFWTQDEGLALMLTVDRLAPGWQAAAFAPQPALAEALLAMAAGEPAARNVSVR